MHLDARFGRVPDGAVAEGVDVEVAAELAVDPDEQVAVERRRDAERIVVREQQLALRLDEIGADEEASPGSSAARMPRRNASAPGRSKLPMLEPRKSTSVRGRRARAISAQSAFVRRLVRHDLDVVQRRQRSVAWPSASALAETSIRCSSSRPGPAAPRLDQRQQLLAVAGPELDDASTGGGTRARISRPCVSSRRELRARDAIPRQLGRWRRRAPTRARRRSSATAAGAARASGSTATSLAKSLSARRRRDVLMSDAAECRIDIWIARPEPVAEGRPQQLVRRRRRGALHDQVLAVEEVRRVFRIRRHRAKPRERRERRAGPFPAVADEILDAPGARARGMAADRLRIPARKVEDAVLGRRAVASPRISPFAVGRAETPRAGYSASVGSRASRQRA